jgi:hypothetical protein
MRTFVIRRNIDRYRQLLKVETDEVRRRMVVQLLAEEEAKLAEYIANQPPKAAE